MIHFSFPFSRKNKSNSRFANDDGARILHCDKATEKDPISGNLSAPQVNTRWYCYRCCLDFK
jgi:hypothetical protein